METRRLLLTREAAEFLRISVSTLNRMRDNGSIEYYKIGFRILFDVDKHLIPYLERCERRIARNNN